jgi:hypothetical protein
LRMRMLSSTTWRQMLRRKIPCRALRKLGNSRETLKMRVRG